jgi:hypothetical protein
MRVAVCSLSSTSPYSQSKAFEIDREEGETLDAKESRTWREKCHVTQDGHIFIPPMAFTLALQYAAKRMGLKIPGGGAKTYSKTFQGGILCIDPIVLPVLKAEVLCERVHVHADGVRGSGKRVFKNFPLVAAWKGQLKVQVLSDEIPEKVFEDTLDYAGKFAGIGRFRPENGGYLGRFEVAKVVWGQQ